MISCKYIKIKKKIKKIKKCKTNWFYIFLFFLESVLIQNTRRVILFFFVNIIDINNKK